MGDWALSKIWKHLKYNLQKTQLYNNEFWDKYISLKNVKTLPEGHIFTIWEYY